MSHGALLVVHYEAPAMDISSSIQMLFGDTDGTSDAIFGIVAIPKGAIVLKKDS